MRHAEAAASAAESDSQRRLTEKGIRDAAAFGEYCLKKGFLPDEALVSTALRAIETYEILINSFPRKPRETFEPALYNASADTILNLIVTTNSEIANLLIVGHNPGIAELAIILASEYTSNRASLDNMHRHFPAPALAVIDFDYACWADIIPGSGNLQTFLTSPALQAGDDF